MRGKKMTQTEVENDALQCMIAVAARTGIPVPELLSNAARQWYDLAGDAPASHIRWEIREGKKKAA